MLLAVGSEVFHLKLGKASLTQIWYVYFCDSTLLLQWNNDLPNYMQLKISGNQSQVQITIFNQMHFNLCIFLILLTWVWN